MDGPPLTDAHFFPPQREALDLFRVVGELTSERYRLYESRAHFSGGYSTGNPAFDSLLTHLRRSADDAGAATNVSVIFDLHVVHPRPQKEYFRFIVEECFSKL